MNRECIDCGDYAEARGRCQTCYQRARRTGTIDIMHARVSDEEALMMRCLKRQGLSLHAIARTVGRAVTTVHRYCGGE